MRILERNKLCTFEILFHRFERFILQQINNSQEDCCVPG
jgi:hypothetical protein